MEQIFGARSVALVGVSDKPDNLARVVLENLLRWDYRGSIYCVNPRGGEVLGFPIYRSISDLPEVVDLALILVPAAAVPDVVEECGRKGITRLAISTGGFDELDGKGESLRERLVRVARRYGIRFVGPNSLAIINAHTGLCLPFLEVPPDIPRGGISLVTQSGGIGMDFLSRLREMNVGFSKWASVGNKTDLDEVDYLEYLGRDDETKVICLYLEDVQRGRELIRIASRLEKPILAFKANVMPQTRQSARSHTAALANDDDVLEGAFRQAGIIRVDRLSHLAAYSTVFSLPPLRGNRIALTSPTGGILVVAADQCARRGFEFPPLPSSLAEEIKVRMRAGVVNISNPLDLVDVQRSEDRLFVIERLLQQDFIDGVILILVARLTRRGEVATGGILGINENMFQEIGKLMEKYHKPVVTGLLAGSEVLDRIRKVAGFPLYDDPEQTVDAAAILRDYYLRRKAAEEMSLHEVIS